MRRHTPFEPIDAKTCVWCGVPDVINCGNIFENWSRGLGAGIPRKTAFPIESIHRPYNSVSTAVLHCDVPAGIHSFCLHMHVCVCLLQAYSSIAKCIAALSIACPQYGSSVVAQFIADIKVTALYLVYFLAECHKR